MQDHPFHPPEPPSANTLCLRLLALAVLLQLLVGCRFSPSEATWVEQHGGGDMRAIAASSRGLAAFGSRSTTYTCPGDWGRPWLEAWSKSGVALGATDQATYVVTDDGDMWRLAPSPRQSQRLHFTRQVALFGGRNDDLYGILDGAVQRLTGPERDRAIDCGVKAKRLAVTEREVYVLADTGNLFRFGDNACSPFALSKTIDDIAATSTALYALKAGVPYVVHKGRLEALPVPILHRGAVNDAVLLNSLSASKNSLWALSQKGQVFLLQPP